MQTADIVLRLAGNVLNTVPKQDVTPAEVIILREIHGSDSVVDIRVKPGNDKRSHADEWGRLADIYSSNGALAGPSAKAVMLDKLFPGAVAVKRLPVTFDEAGIDVTGAPAEAEADAA